MPAGLSPSHLVIIFVVALIVLGPDKMPDAVRKGARLLGEARQWSERISAEVQSAVTEHTQDLLAPKAEASAESVDPVVPEVASPGAETPAVSYDSGAERASSDEPPSSSEPDLGVEHTSSATKEQP